MYVTLFTVVVLLAEGAVDVMAATTPHAPAFQFGSVIDDTCDGNTACANMTRITVSINVVNAEAVMIDFIDQVIILQHRYIYTLTDSSETVSYTYDSTADEIRTTTLWLPGVEHSYSDYQVSGQSSDFNSNECRGSTCVWDSEDCDEIVLDYNYDPSLWDITAVPSDLNPEDALAGSGKVFTGTSFYFFLDGVTLFANMQGGFYGSCSIGSDELVVVYYYKAGGGLFQNYFIPEAGAEVYVEWPTNPSIEYVYHRGFTAYCAHGPITSVIVRDLSLTACDTKLQPLD